MANAYVTTLSIEHNFRGGDPLGDAKALHKQGKLRLLILLLRALTTGSTAPGAIARFATAAASATVTFSSTGPSAADTVTVNGIAFTATQLNATGTITCASVANANTVTVAGTVLTAKTSPTLATEWARGGTDTADALALVACINANCTTVQAKSALGVVTVRAVTLGTAGNAITLASSDGATLAVSGATLANGAARGTNQFDYVGTVTNTAADFVTAFNASATTLIASMFGTATSVAGVATITALRKGLGGNAYTLAKSGANIAVTGGGRLAGGTETAYTMT